MNEQPVITLSPAGLLALQLNYSQAEYSPEKRGFYEKIMSILSQHGILPNDSRLAIRYAAWIICHGGALPDMQTRMRIHAEYENEKM